ncbi:hypothetical protein [Paraburkholderia fungorum]|uniref:hypothetical protein n=1 Tax=Paraburkholderia fungorum TaxID=134537 RepID=UPI0038B71350
MSTLPLLAEGASPLGRLMIDDDFLENPYPTYQALRDAGPMHWSDEFFGGAWLLTRPATNQEGKCAVAVRTSNFYPNIQSAAYG